MGEGENNNLLKYLCTFHEMCSSNLRLTSQIKYEDIVKYVK